MTLASAYCKKTKWWTSFLFHVLFLFLFYIFILHFLIIIFRTLGIGLGVIGHTVTSVTSDGVVTILITELERRK